MVAPLIADVFDLFARGGGGGSGGGGGDGGGGIIAIGYIPMHGLGALLRRHGSSNVVASVAQQIVGWVVAIIYAIFWIVVWRGIGVIVAAGAILGIGAGLYNWFGKVKQSKLVSGKLKTAAATDSAWDETKLTEFAKQTFLRYQEDWSQFKTESMRTYMTPRYHYHASLLMYALQLMGRRDVMANVEIQDATITDAHDSVNDAEDQFTIGITAKAHDQLIETATDEHLFTDDGTFTEYWHFQRSGTTWLLAGITQATADAATYNAGINAFAGTNKFYYSADMGWLFLPKRGQLFGKGKFGTSDINNHVIGMYNNQLLMQFYSFIANYNPSGTSTKPLIIAQVNVPKNYGQIIVRRKKGLSFFDKPRGLEEVKTEWIEFNGKYEVFAATPEQATSFELLNPTYMEKLAALPFEVNIEVVDNVIYLYSPEAKTDASHYSTMLSLVYDAFKEMRL
jgi:hypothetical protein